MSAAGEWVVLNDPIFHDHHGETDDLALTDSPYGTHQSPFSVVAELVYDPTSDTLTKVDDRERT